MSTPGCPQSAKNSPFMTPAKYDSPFFTPLKYGGGGEMGGTPGDSSDHTLVPSSPRTPPPNPDLIREDSLDTPPPIGRPDLDDSLLRTPDAKQQLRSPRYCHYLNKDPCYQNISFKS